MDKEKIFEYTVEIVKAALQGNNDNPGHGLNVAENITALIQAVYDQLNDISNS